MHEITEILLKVVVLITITIIQENKTGSVRNYIVLDFICPNYESGGGT
jgi:hypothetical protein